MYPIDELGHELLLRAEKLGYKPLASIKGHKHAEPMIPPAWFDYDPYKTYVYPWGAERPLQPEFTPRSIPGGKFSPNSQNWIRHCDINDWFRKHADRILKAFIKATHGTLEKAVKETLHFSILFIELHAWWKKKEELFMAQYQLDIAEVQNVVGKFNKQSMGAAANLCKVLTRTMEKQGADIGSIAKVQYAVCTQAGIYIPDEFMRDVAVALTVEESNC